MQRELVKHQRGPDTEEDRSDREFRHSAVDRQGHLLGARRVDRRRGFRPD